MSEEIGLGESADDELIEDIDLDVNLEAEEGEDLEDDDNNNLTPEEIEQMKHGWKPKDQYKGDPDDWVSAKKFKQTGELLSEIGRLKSTVKETTENINDRLANATMFVNMQNNMLRQQLEEKKMGYIQEGDVDGVKAMDNQLKKIPEESVEEKPDKKPDSDITLFEWKADRPWVFDESSQKFKYADNLFKITAAKGMSLKEQLDYIDEQVALKYPEKSRDVNQRRNEPGLGDPAGKNSSSRSSSKLIPKSQWTNVELGIAESLEDKFTSKEIAQMVSDSRSKA